MNHSFKIRIVLRLADRLGTRAELGATYATTSTASRSAPNRPRNVFAACAVTRLAGVIAPAPPMSWPQRILLRAQPETATHLK